MTAPASGDKAAKTRGELLTGPVFPMAVKFGVPTMVSMLTPAIYNLTGAYFVSTLGTTAVAALGIVFSLHMILAAVGIMTGQGCASQTSRLLGAGEYEAAGFIAGTGILLSVLGGVAIGVLGLLFDEPLLRVLGATPTIMPDAVRYAEVLLIGSPVVCASFTFNNLLRSEGLAVVGMRALLAGGILNLALTPAFILGLGFGIEGAAWAAVLSQAAGLLILVNHYRRKAGLLRIIPPTLERLRRLSPTILRNGMPSLLRNALAAVAASILNLTAGGFGDAAVAAMSIVGRVLMTVNAVMVGLGQGYQPVAGFNWGAGNYARVKKALVSTIVAGTAFTTAAAIPGFIFSESIVSVFAGGDPEVMETGTTAMRWAFAGFPFIAVSMIANMTYQVLGRPKAASFLSSLRQGWCFLPLILTLPGWFGLTGLCASQPLAEVLATLVSLRWIRAIVLEADDLTAKKNASRKA